MTYAEILRGIDQDSLPVNQNQSERIRAAILEDGRTHGGGIDPNRVRKVLADEPLYHRRIGAAYYGLLASKLIARNGIGESDDKVGRNAGKLIRMYRLTEAGWQA